MADEKHLGRALVGQSPPSAGAIDGKTMLAAGMKREQSRVRGWTIGAIAMWILVAGLLGLIHWAALVFVYPKLIHTWTEAAGLAEDANRELTGALATIVQMATAAHIIWAVLLLLASAMTIKLVLASRRATLGQIQASLAEMSEQLRELAQNRNVG
jgi:hypothetical protein